MSTFDLTASLERANKRLVKAPARRRSDVGRSRLPAPINRRLTKRLRGQERPSIRQLQAELAQLSSSLGFRPVSRATIYNAVARCRPARMRAKDLPAYVRLALYNLDLTSTVDAAQVAFYAFNYGDLRAVCWAAGMPWLALYHAARVRGWRPKSLGLLLATMQCRGIQ